MKPKPNVKLHDHGDYMLRIEALPQLTRYTLVSEKKTLLDFFILDDGSRVKA